MIIIPVRYKNIFKIWKERAKHWERVLQQKCLYVGLNSIVTWISQNSSREGFVNKTKKRECRHTWRGMEFFSFHHISGEFWWKIRRQEVRGPFFFFHRRQHNTNTRPRMRATFTGFHAFSKKGGPNGFCCVNNKRSRARPMALVEASVEVNDLGKVNAVKVSGMTFPWCPGASRGQWPERMDFRSRYGQHIPTSKKNK